MLADKITDDSHAGRLLPLSQLAVRSLAAYGLHLESLASNSALTAAERKAATQALSGESSLFFLVENRKARPVAPKDLAATVPEGWDLPNNFLRHRAATRLRELGCPALFVQALMGHLEAGIQPFGDEGFMDPRAYLRTTARVLDTLMGEEGWRPLLGGSDDISVFERHAPAMDASLRGLAQKWERAVHKKYLKGRSDARAHAVAEGDRVAALVRERAMALVPDGFIDGQASWTLTKSDLGKLRASICSDADGLSEIETRVEALRSLLLEMRKSGGWKTPAPPRFYMAEPTPSVFLPTFVPAYSMVLRLREWFSRSLTDGSVSAADRPALNLCLALVLWHGIADAGRFQAVWHGISHRQRLRTLPDAVLVPIRISSGSGEVESSEILRGAVALAASRAGTHYTALPTLDEVNAALRRALPREIMTAEPGQALQLLFAAASLTHRFETLPPLRRIWSDEIRSVSLPPARIRALVDGERTTWTSEEDAAEPTENFAAPAQAQDAPLTYSWLKQTLRHRGREAKSFPAIVIAGQEICAATELSKKQQAQVRAETCVRLEMALRHWPTDGRFLRALTQYGLHLLRSGTPWNAKIEQDTVYRYVVGAGTRILRQISTITGLETEDFAVLYERCVLSTPKNHRDQVSDYLAYFHGFLVRSQLAPPVAIGRKRDTQSLPDVGYVTPSEIQASLEACEAGSDSQSTGGLDSIAVASHARVGQALGFASGARTGEVFHRDARELTLGEDEDALSIRANGWGRVKTLRSYRCLSLKGYLPAVERHRIKEWTRRSEHSPRTRRPSPLFTAPGTSHMVDGDQVSRWITYALRTATGCSRARPYWWRHTSASNDLLSIADPELLEQIRSTYPAEARPWVPRVELLTSAVAPDVPVGQLHAAAYRARRGHASFNVSLENYVHTVALIEPPASRGVCEALTLRQLSNLVGCSHDALRKLLSRAKLPRQTANLAAMLMPALPPDVEPAAVHRPASPPLAKVDPVAVAECVVDALLAGDWQRVRRTLRLTDPVMESLEQRLKTAAASNASEIVLPGLSNTASPTVIRAGKPIDLRGARLDRAWSTDCMARARGEVRAREAWRAVLSGFDPASGCIAVKSVEELTLLDASLAYAICADTKRLAAGWCVARSYSPPTGSADLRRWARQHLTSTEAGGDSHAFRPSIGTLPIGFCLRSDSTSRPFKGRGVLAVALAIALMEPTTPASSDS